MPRTRTIADLRRELAAKERQLTGLQNRRRKLAQQLNGLDRKIASLGGMAASTRPNAKPGPKRSTRRLRSKNTKPLLVYVQNALAKSPKGLRVKEVMEAVQRAGYKSRSKDFYGIVASTLREAPFQRVARGIYRLKTTKKASARKVAKKKMRKKAAKKTRRSRKVARRKTA